MNKIAIPALLILISLLGCKQDNPISKTIAAQAIIDKAIAISGGDIIDTSTIKFDFREATYTAMRYKGQYEYMKTFNYNDSLLIREVLNNNTYKRYHNNKLVSVPDSLLTRYADGLNSVHYFSILPYGLNDAAVKKERLEKAKINHIEYEQIKITFNKEGGGTDFEDEYIYWINTTTHKVDYLAYNYRVNGGGIRFREAFNERIINDVRFVDYNNYRTNDLSTPLEKLPLLYESNKLEFVSKILLENIEVK